METGWVYSIAVTVGGLLLQGAYLKGVFATKIEEHDRRLTVIETGVVWEDECNRTHGEVDRRLDRSERKENGKAVV